MYDPLGLPGLEHPALTAGLTLIGDRRMKTSCARAWALTANMFINRWVYCLVGARMMLSYRGARDCEGKRDGTDGRTEDASKVYGSTYMHICISAYTTWVLLSMQPYWYTQR